MPLRLPPRREPRVLAFVRFPAGFSYAVADPWELRAVGSIRCRALTLGPTVLRVIRREKPTLVVTRDRDLKGPAERSAKRLGIPATDAGLPNLPLAVAAEMFPELRMRAVTPSLSRAGVLAIAAVLYADSPTRKYAPRRQRPPEHSP
jgi:hypothetical protein